MIILISGTRHAGVGNAPFIRDRLDKILESFECPRDLCHFIHGAADGVDTIGAQWAAANKLNLHRFPAQWDLHDRAAGPIRNSMMNHFAEYLFGFHSPRGYDGDIVRIAFPRKKDYEAKRGGTYNMIKLWSESKDLSEMSICPLDI